MKHHLFLHSQVRLFTGGKQTLKSRFVKVLSCLTCCSLVACGGGGNSSDSPVESEKVIPLPELNLLLSDVSFGVDVNAPVAVNHRIPIAFTLSSPVLEAVLSDASFPARFPEDFAYNIPVTFVFVEKDPADPQAPIQCSSNAIDVELIPSAGPAVVEGEFIWPVSECADAVGEGKEMALHVEFYHDDQLLAVNVGEPLPDISLQQSEPNIEFDLTLDSSVAIVPPQQNPTAPQQNPTEQASSLPLLSVNTSFVYNGADPYYSLVTPDEIPEDLREEEPEIEAELAFGLDDEALQNLDLLPGEATLVYSLVPVNAPSEALPLFISEDSGAMADSFSLTRIEPGVDEGLSHDLYLDEAGMALLNNSDTLAQESDFVLRGCLATSFVQGGNESNSSASSSTDNCREVAVLLVREVAEEALSSGSGFQSKGASLAEASQNQLQLDSSFKRGVGGKRLKLNVAVASQSLLQSDKVENVLEGEVSIKGKLGRRFQLDIARTSQQSLLLGNTASTETRLEMFGQTLFNRQTGETELTVERTRSRQKSVEVGRLGFGFGPVRFGFRLGVGGRAGFGGQVSMALLADGAAGCAEQLEVEEQAVAACGTMAVSAGPFFSMTGRVFGGFKSPLVKVGVAANIDVVDTRFPLTATLGFGVLEQGGSMVNGRMDWNMALTPVAGKVKLVGSIRLPFKRLKRSVTVFKFKSKTHRYNLFSRSTGPVPIL